MSPCLRIIRDKERPAKFNMSADRLLFARATSSHDIVLRFYGWSPPAISLGCMQDPSALLDHKELAHRGIEWVKRPTGGRAVLHWNDITYSCVFSSELTSFGKTIRQTYALFGRCLMNGLATAGITCRAQDSAAEFIATKRDIALPCFLSPNRDEIMAMGKKLAGSAQKRTGDAVLQHGSIPVDGSFRQLPEFLVMQAAERERQKTLLGKKCICLGEIVPAIDKKNLIDCLIKGFVEVLGITMSEKAWDEEELSEINRRASLRD